MNAGCMFKGWNSTVESSTLCMKVDQFWRIRCEITIDKLKTDLDHLTSKFNNKLREVKFTDSYYHILLYLLAYYICFYAWLSLDFDLSIFMQINWKSNVCLDLLMPRIRINRVFRQWADLSKMSNLLPFWSIQNVLVSIKCLPTEKSSPSTKILPSAKILPFVKSSPNTKILAFANFLVIDEHLIDKNLQISQRCYLQIIFGQWKSKTLKL